MHWKKKLTSRKWWTAIIGVIISLMVLFNVDSETSERITALITAVSSAVAYTLAEGFVDGKAAQEREEKNEYSD